MYHRLDNIKVIYYSQKESKRKKKGRKKQKRKKEKRIHADQHVESR